MEVNNLFIIGISRTGSKFYMQILNSNKDIYIAPELMFKHPIKRNAYSAISEILNKKNRDSLIETIYSLNFKGSYKTTIKLIEPNTLANQLAKEETLTPYIILKSILDLAAKSKGKSVYGAKFPVHYSYTKELLKEFNNSLVLFLTRDPRDIYFSDFTKKRKEQSSVGTKFPIKGLFLKPAVLFYTIWEWSRSIGVYEKSNIENLNRIKLFKFEEIIKNENKVIKNIANFTGFKTNEFPIENVKVVGSSFAKKPALNRWEKELNFIEKLLFKLLIGRKMKKYGYK